MIWYIDLDFHSDVPAAYICEAIVESVAKVHIDLKLNMMDVAQLAGKANEAPVNLPSRGQAN